MIAPIFQMASIEIACLESGQSIRLLREVHICLLPIHIQFLPNIFLPIGPPLVRRNGSVEFYGGKIKVTRTLSSFLTKFSLIFTFFVLSIFSTKNVKYIKEEILSFLSFC